MNLVRKNKKAFVEHFKKYIEVGDDDSKYVVDMDEVWEWMGILGKMQLSVPLQSIFKKAMIIGYT